MDAERYLKENELILEVSTVATAAAAAASISTEGELEEEDL